MTPDYTLVRSNRRTLSMEIKELRLIVRAPARMPQRDIDRFVASHSDWIDSHMQKQARRLSNHPEPTDAEALAYIRAAKALLPPKVAHYAGIMGLTPAGITITGARTRFGSCSSKGRLSFSWRLMQYPEEAVDYVVVHELAHLRYMDHSPRFYALIEQYLPDYRVRRKMLKE